MPCYCPAPVIAVNNNDSADVLSECVCVLERVVFVPRLKFFFFVVVAGVGPKDTILSIRIKRGQLIS